MSIRPGSSPFNRRQFIKIMGAATAWGASAGCAATPKTVAPAPTASSTPTSAQPTPPTAPPAPVPDTNNIDFEKTLKKMRFEHYAHPPVDPFKDGFRPVGGRPADFAVAHHNGRDHFFYIERRLQEGTPFFPGHEIYFGHASTADLVHWEVHDPVLLIRPGTWEGGHVWAPMILQNGDEFIMAYTGLNRELSQDIGLASSKDLFEWKRWDSNPISPCKDAKWAAWWPDDICSCRDPHLLRHDGRVWMVYTANTSKGASCVALCSTADFKSWRDEGPILVGPEKGYEAKLWGGHPQGSLESANLSRRGDRWMLVMNASIRGKGGGSWIFESDRIDRFDFQQARRFWPGAGCIEVVRDRGSRSLLAGTAPGIRFGEIDWSQKNPTARFLENVDEMKAWCEGV